MVVRPNAGVALHCIAPAASAFLAEQLATLIVAISHKHTRLPTPYLKEGTVSCLSWGKFSGAGSQVKQKRHSVRVLSAYP